MSKNFWLIIISFWFACIISGFCTYVYIYYSQKQEREQFVSEFKYENLAEIQEENRTSLTVLYDAQLFLNNIQQVLEKMNRYEEQISTMIHSNDNLNSNLDFILTAYQYSKLAKQQFANVEITNSSLLERKQFEKIADATVNYLQASSIYYIISAKRLKQSTPLLEQQYKAAQDTLSTSKSHLLVVSEFHSVNE